MEGWEAAGAGGGGGLGEEGQMEGEDSARARVGEVLGALVVWERLRAVGQEMEYKAGGGVREGGGGEGGDGRGGCGCSASGWSAAAAAPGMATVAGWRVRRP